jgi:hypothetical protein
MFNTSGESFRVSTKPGQSQIMQKMTLISATVIAAVIGIGVYASHHQADAQAAPPPPPMMDAGKDGPMPWMHRREGVAGPMNGMMMAHREWHRRPWGAQNGMELIYPVADKNLSPADVQILAQAMLLRRGNHDWKVTNVVANDDKTISFAYATADGGVIARFAVDPHSGRIHRVG